MKRPPESLRRPWTALLLIPAVLILFLVPALSPRRVWAAEETLPATQKTPPPRFELETLVVTGTRVEDEVKSLPQSVTVITSEDIKQAPSNNLVDLLSREVGIQLRSSFGHDKWGGVDLRGFGDTSASNVVVLVDGVRINPPDATGPDLTSVPLDLIERIEILRGAGSVLYGDGAVGGVVNIITRKGTGQPAFRALASAGSFGTLDGRSSLGGEVRKLRFNANADQYATEGFRDNGFLKKKDLGLFLGRNLGGRVSLRASAAYHEDEYGLPGPVSRDDFGSAGGRRSTRFPHDEGGSQDQRYTAGMDMDLGLLGQLELNRAYHFREVDYILGFTPLLDREDQTSTIDEDTRSFSARQVKVFEAWGLEHRLQLGVDHEATGYVRSAPSQAMRHNSRLEKLGAFAAGRVGLTRELTAHLGYRYGVFSGLFREDEFLWFGDVRRWVNGDQFDERWRKSAWDLGLVYAPRPDTSFFASLATSYRFPNVDELAQAEDGLGPQTGAHLEVGGRRSFGDRAEASITLFVTRIEDEIYYGEDPATGIAVNRNYERPTLRRGVEVEVRARPARGLYAWANGTFMEARFEGMSGYIPLVPRYQARVGLEWEMREGLTASAAAAWVGKRFDGNDPTNVLYEPLPAYETVDVKLTWRRKTLTFFVGVNNLFDQAYATAAYSESLYPMPGRNVYAGVSILLEKSKPAASAR
jgi:outer membrane receptor protein involved in Fe transport